MDVEMRVWQRDRVFGRRSAWVSVFLMGLCAPLLWGCDQGSEQTCVPGESRACVGPGGCAGGQVCEPGGSSFAFCDCGGGADAGVSTPDAAPRPDDAGMMSMGEDGGVAGDAVSNPDAQASPQDAGMSTPVDASGNRSLIGGVRAGLSTVDSAFARGPLTIEGWFYLGENSVTLFTGGAKAPSSAPWRLLRSGTKGARFKYRCENEETREVDFSFELLRTRTFNEGGVRHTRVVYGWYHVALQLERDAIAVWRNGVAVARTTLRCNRDVSVRATQFWVGDDDGTIRVDEVHVRRGLVRSHPDSFDPEYPMTADADTILLWSIIGSDTAGAVMHSSAAGQQLRNVAAATGEPRAEIEAGIWSTDSAR